MRLINATRETVVAACVHQARTLRARALGLLAMPPLGPDEALWLDPCGGVHTWGMRYPIDIVFLDRHLRVVGVRREVPPWRLAFAPRGTRSVVELPSGSARAVEPGDKFRLEIPPEPG